jgi:hypothetical protein
MESLSVALAKCECGARMANRIEGPEEPHEEKGETSDVSLCSCVSEGNKRPYLTRSSLFSRQRHIQFESAGQNGEEAIFTLYNA